MQNLLFQTALCNTALDNPGKLTSHDIVSHILEYFSTDTLLFHTDVSTYLLVMLSRSTLTQQQDNTYKLSFCTYLYPCCKLHYSQIPYH